MVVQLVTEDNTPYITSPYYSITVQYYVWPPRVCRYGFATAYWTILCTANKYFLQLRGFVVNSHLASVPPRICRVTLAYSGIQETKTNTKRAPRRTEKKRKDQGSRTRDGEGEGRPRTECQRAVAFIRRVHSNRHMNMYITSVVWPLVSQPFQRHLRIPLRSSSMIEIT